MDSGATTDDLPSDSQVAHLHAAVSLAEFLLEQPGRELLGKDLNLFYKWAPSHKKTVQCAKVQDRERGIQSLCAMFSDKLAVRKVTHENGGGFDVVLMRTEDAKTHSNLAVRLATVVAGAYDPNDSGQAALASIDSMLRDLDLGSMTKLKKEVGALGICLRDGTQHGTGLRSALRNGKALTVKKELAKKYEFAKKCLVTL
jgi:hypothetical protein